MSNAGSGQGRYTSHERYPWGLGRLSSRARIWSDELELAAALPAKEMRARVLRIAGELDRAGALVLEEVQAMIAADETIDAARAQQAAEVTLSGPGARAALPRLLAHDPELVAVIEPGFALDEDGFERRCAYGEHALGDEYCTVNGCPGSRTAAPGGAR